MTTTATPTAVEPPRPPTRAGRRSPRLLALAPAAVTTVLALLLVPSYRYGIALDGLSYLSVAQSWARGDLSAALNPYWSPLYSWLVVPALLVGVPPLLAATVLAALVAGGTVLALGRLLRASGVRLPAQLLTTSAVVPFVLAATHFGKFADLLLAALLLAVLAELVREGALRSRGSVVRLGVLAGLAYLAKLFALPLLAIVLPLGVAVQAVRAPADQRRRVVAGGALAVVVAAAVAAPWVVALSISEGRPTVGTAASHNVTLVAPGSRGNPITYAGLVEPPHDRAFSVWEDPSTMQVEADTWTGSEQAAADRLLENVERNAEAGWEALTDWGAVLLVLGAVGTAVVLVRPRRPVDRLVLAVVLAAAGAYACGYLLTWVEDRYTWFLLLCAAVPLGMLVDRVAATRAGWGGSGLVAVAALVGLLPPSLDTLRLKADSGRELAIIINEARRQGLVEPGQRVASVDNYQRSAILCFSLDCRYLGLPASPDDALRELEDAEVDRLLLWSPQAQAPSGVEPRGSAGPLRVAAVP